MVIQRTKNALPYPSDCIRNEFDVLVQVKSLVGFHDAYVAFSNKIL